MSEQPDYHSKGVVLSRHVLFMAFTSHSRECYGYSGVRVLLGCPVSHNSGGIPKVTTSAIWNVWWLGNKEDGLPPLRKLTISEWSSQDLLKRVWELRRLMLVLEVGSRATHGMAITYLRAVRHGQLVHMRHGLTATRTRPTHTVPGKCQVLFLR